MSDTRAVTRVSELPPGTRRYRQAGSNFYVALQGTDNVTMQAVSSTYTYDAKDFRFGHRFVDTLRVLDGERFLVDLRNFDLTVPDTDAR